jgi:hypothetical protein
MRCNTKKYTQRGFVEALVPLLFWGGVIFMIYFVGTQFAGKKIKNQTENSATNCLPIKMTRCAASPAVQAGEDVKIQSRIAAINLFVSAVVANK